ncbi:hypothetical protein OHB26_39655 (plasmid) [Nocardia sp. NBC_01503]|uniref:hypothetical protein n=1 Tax=Nocardia sp. NBC_01503 TaxID=2975997 RepID=UPI002E7B979E|nr:hypothetical protein [Nocardia sp. NBC_01503]WTL36652.1 hypothetical protein OHB26_38920 [Nocardia sp. NBC_01503]WTL36795.1 hypothetical protein OHB26_39655 [Nocardia sp. NBC_01503]
MSAITPRISQTPDSVIDLVDRQLTRATNRGTHNYYKGLLDYVMNTLKVVQSTLILLIIAGAAAFVIFAAGIAAAVYLAGMPLHVAVGVGVLGGSASTVFGSITVGRWALKALRHFKSVTDRNEKSFPDDPPSPAPEETPAP